MRTLFVQSWAGAGGSIGSSDVDLSAIIEDINNIWSFIGAGDNIYTTSGTWTDTGPGYAFEDDPGDLWSAIDILNSKLGDTTYSGGNFISGGTTHATSVTELDKVLASGIDRITELEENLTVHDHASITMGGPAFATYYSDPVIKQEGS